MKRCLVRIHSGVVEVAWCCWRYLPVVLSAKDREGHVRLAANKRSYLPYLTVKVGDMFTHPIHYEDSII